MKIPAMTISSNVPLPQSNLQEAPEREIVQRAQRGDSAAFECLYQRHSRRVYALCLRMVGNPADAEELAQDAFLQAFRKLVTFRGDSAFSTWLHRLTVNVVLMRFRRKTIKETSLDDDRHDEQERPAHEIGGPDLRLEGWIDRARLEQAVQQLPAGYRMAFILHDIQGYEHNEIAALTGRTIGNSKSQVHKARMRLRDLLNEPGRAAQPAERFPALGKRQYKAQRVSSCGRKPVAVRGAPRILQPAHS